MKYILSVSLIVFCITIFGCKPKQLSNNSGDVTKTTTYRSRSELNTSVEEKFSSGYEVYKKDSVNYLVKHYNSDSNAYRGILNVAINVESFKFNHLIIKDPQTKFVDLDKQSGIVSFNDIVGFKFYRFISEEYGHYYNYIKYDVFLNQNGYWIRIGENPYQLVTPQKKEAAYSGNYIYSVSTDSDVEKYDYKIGYFEK